MTKKELYFSGEGFGTSLLVSVIDEFSTEFLDWEPETLEMEFSDKYGVAPSRGTLDRIEAAKGLLKSNIFYRDLASFSMVCRALNFRRVSSGEFIPADLNDVMWAITEADILLGGTDGGDTVFSTPVSLYVGKLLEEQGILDPPKILSFARMKRLGISNQALAEMPDLGEIFEANQADTRGELEELATAKLKMMFTQIGGLKLDNTDLSDYNKRIDRILNGDSNK